MERYGYIMVKSRKRVYIWFILPGLIIYFVFMILPLIQTVQYSFFEWAGIGEKKFIGIDNYIHLFTDKRSIESFTNALGNNLKYIVYQILIVMPAQIFFAWLLHKKVTGHRLFQPLIFLPYIFSPTIIGFFGILIFDPNMGILNQLLSGAGLSGLIRPWFSDPAKAFNLLFGMAFWNGVGVSMMIFLANMKSVPGEVMEAAVVDGAGEWQRFRSILLPFLRPALINVIILDTIWGFTFFDLPYIITGPTGGVGGATDFLNLLFYRNAFNGAYSGASSTVGYAACISTVLFLIIAVISLIQNILLNKLEIY